MIAYVIHGGAVQPLIGFLDGHLHGRQLPLRPLLPHGGLDGDGDDRLGGSSNGTSGSDLNTGGRYNPSSDSWTATSTGANCPSGRAITRPSGRGRR